MLLRFLILVLGASTLAMNGSALAQQSVPAVPRVPGGAAASAIEVPKAVATRHPPGVQKDGGGSVIQCVEELPDGSWRMAVDEYSDSPCNLNLPNGVFIRLWQGEVITTELKGDFAYGTIARVYTSGLPFKLFGDQRHLIEPNATIEIVIEDGLTHIFSKEGRTSVIACGVSEDSACVRRGFTLLEGDKITLMREGQVYSWENAEGDDLTLENTGGCSVGNGSQPSLWTVLLVMWTILWLRRRSMVRDS